MKTPVERPGIERGWNHSCRRMCLTSLMSQLRLAAHLVNIKRVHNNKHSVAEWQHPTWTVASHSVLYMCEVSSSILIGKYTSSTCTCHIHSIVCISYLSYMYIISMSSFSFHHPTSYFLLFLSCKLRRSHNLWSTRRYEWLGLVINIVITTEGGLEMTPLMTITTSIDIQWNP